MKQRRKMERVHSRKIDRAVARGLCEKKHILHNMIKLDKFKDNWRQIAQEVK